MGKFKEVLTKNSIPPEVANELVKMHLDVIDGMHDAYYKQIDEWEKQSRADTMIGGAGEEGKQRLEKSVAKAEDVIKNFSTDSEHQARMSKLLTDYGIGSNPDVIKFLVNVYEKVRDDSIINSIRGQREPEQKNPRTAYLAQLKK